MEKNKSEFIKRISKHFPMSEEEIHVFSDRFSITNHKKGNVLMKEGDRIDRVYFIIKGIVRQYKQIEGVDMCMFFYTEDQIIRLMGDDQENPRSKYNLQCLEDCIVCVAYSSEDDFEFIQKYLKSIDMQNFQNQN